MDRVSTTTIAALPAALKEARAAQATWAATSLSSRANVVGRVASVLAKRRLEVAHAIAHELQKPVSEALFAEVLTVCEHAKTLSQRAPSVLAASERAVRVAPHKRSVVERVPWGVVGVIAPWNFPLAIPGTEIIAALLAGNAVVFKPSEYVPTVARVLISLFLDAGVDPRLLICLDATREAGAALVESDIDYLVFTGSTKTGDDVQQRAARRRLPVRLELGGKGTAIVLDDAPVSRTAKALVWGAFLNSGQVCAAVQRAFVHRSLMPALVEEIVQATRALRHGDTESPDVELAALVPPSLANHVGVIVDDALKHGATLVAGVRPDDGAARIRPVVLMNVARDAKAITDECFGPVLALTAFDVDDDAMTLAHSAAGDLIVSVFSEDRRRAAVMASQLRFGTVLINDVVWSYGMPEVPWGGIRKSGLHATHGDEGLLGYTFPRHVAHERTRILDEDPLWFPYSRARFSLVEKSILAVYGGAEAVGQSLMAWARKSRDKKTMKTD